MQTFDNKHTGEHMHTAVVQLVWIVLTITQLYQDECDLYQGYVDGYVLPKCT